MPITPDSLTDLATCKALLGLNGSAQDVMLNGLITQTSAAVARWCRRPLFLASNSSNPVNEFLSGKGFNRLLLTHAPVQAPILTGTTTAGSAVVTGLSSTLYLFPTQCVSGANLGAGDGTQNVPNPLPGSYIVSVDSTTQVTLNQPAVASGTAPLVFGLGVWVDSGGWWGSAANSFGANTQLFEGAGFALRRDASGGSESNAGWLERINGTWEGRSVRDRGALASHIEDGQGNCRVTYWCGYQSVPDDLRLAVAQIVAFVRRWGPDAEAFASESVGAMLGGKGGGAGGQTPEIASARGVLTQYRRLR
jgi:hypothetical protein